MAELIQIFGQSPLLFGALAGLLAAFLLFFVGGAIRLGITLRRAIRGLREAKNLDKAAVEQHLQQTFSSKFLSPLWREFQETLHPQYRVVGGQRVVSDLRATVPADALFNTETVIEPHLHAEFFKHLPGLFTGIGIIGTFLGLIAGLLAFDPSADPDALKKSLDGLFGHVQEAFTISALAIALAMVVTFVEKFVFARANSQLLGVVQALDDLFRVGVGEEYLQSLVTSAQESATQTRQLKDALIDEIKSALTNLGDRHSQAMIESSERLGRQIETSLKEPLSQIASVVETAHRGQGAMVQTTLENLLAGFMGRLEDLFGGQIGQINTLMQSTAGAMGAAQQSLLELVSEMKGAQRESGAEMQRQVQELIAQVAAQQQAMTDQFAASQRQSADQFGSDIVQIRDKLKEVTTQLLGAQAELSRVDEERRARSDAALEGLLTRVDERIDGLVDANRRTTDAAQSSVEAAHKVSMDAIDGVHAATEALHKLLAQFNSAVERQASLINNLSGTEARIVQAGQVLAQGSAQLAQAGQALVASTSSVSALTARLEKVAADIARDAEQRTNHLRQIEQVVALSAQAAEHMNQYFKGMDVEVARSFEVFANGAAASLKRVLETYDVALRDSVKQLKSGIDDLTDAVESVPTRR